jgi:hypothetical protein
MFMDYFLNTRYMYIYELNFSLNHNDFVLFRLKIVILFCAKKCYYANVKNSVEKNKMFVI